MSQAPEILIVEDSVTQRELLRHILETEGYPVTAAANGAQALELLHARKPGILLSDILMPQMDGFELCRRVKTAPELRDIPVVLLTALSDPKDVIQGLECGADNFVVKPYDAGDLLRRLEYIRMNSGLQTEAADGTVDIQYSGQRYRISSQKRQILNLLLSIYEAAMLKNTELESARQELKAANASLEQKVRERTAKLENANQSLESFCYSIAHDLRSPLRAIQGYTSILLEQYHDMYNQESRENSARVMAAARRMDQLLQDLLAFGRISQAELKTTQVSLEAEVEAVLQSLEQDIRNREAKVEVRHPLPAVQANASVLEQVLTNLLTNALKFTKDGVPPRIEIWADERDSEAVTVSIKDNGIGIDPAHSKRLFGVFQRLHDTQKYPGTGIGLVIVRKGVERMGGRVGFQSQEGQGARFWIELPKPSSNQ